MWAWRHSFPEGGWSNGINDHILLLCQAMALNSQRFGSKCLHLKWSSNTFALSVPYPNSVIEVGPATLVPHTSPAFNTQQSTWKNNTSGSLLGDTTVQEVPSPHKRGTFIFLEVTLHVARTSHKVGGTALFNCLSQDDIASSWLEKPCHIPFKICSHLQHSCIELQQSTILAFLVGSHLSSYGRDSEAPTEGNFFHFFSHLLQGRMENTFHYKGNLE